MKGYLGETIVTNLKGTPYEGFGPTEWALEFIGRYGGIDGAHHKSWVLDQVARILHGARVVVKYARWKGGKGEYRFSVGEPTNKYHGWVSELRGDIDPETGQPEYDYDVGIPP